MARAARHLLLALAALALACLCAPVAGQAQSNAELCSDAAPGVINCGPGNNRTSGGGQGTGKVPHNDGAGHEWPALSGILWQVLDGESHDKTGGPLNDELLGHHGSDVLRGGDGHDILWGDWDPKGNSKSQRDTLDGGPGKDWLYPSHGRSTVRGGAGTDYVYAFYGKGTIDCGPGTDTARIRTNGAFTTKNCERIRHFCAHGEDKKGNCLSPSGTPVQSARRR